MVDIKDVAGVVAASGERGLRLRQGKVSSIQTGSVTITIGGSTATVAGVKYLASYSPTTNDAVWMLSDGRNVIILGKLA